MTPTTLKGRSLLSLQEFSASEITLMLDTAEEFKRLRRAGVRPKALDGRNIALIFLKPSCRTRVSFVVASTEAGAQPEIFNKEDIRFGIKESVRDIARVFGRVFDGIMFRGFEHETVVELSKYAGIPVWNGLCDSYHPTQVLADLLTIRENFGSLRGVPVAYVGDGNNNMTRTLAIASYKLGIDFRVLAPTALHLTEEFLSPLRAVREAPEGRVRVTHKPREALDGAAVVYGDVWVSMGEEDRAQERIDLLRGYKVTVDMMALTGRKDTIYLHCLPAFHELDTTFAQQFPDIREVDDDVFEGPQSRVFDQSENRMHTAKALMALTVV